MNTCTKCKDGWVHDPDGGEFACDCERGVEQQKRICEYCGGFDEHEADCKDIQISCLSDKIAQLTEINECLAKDLGKACMANFKRASERDAAVAELAKMKSAYAEFQEKHGIDLRDSTDEPGMFGGLLASKERLEEALKFYANADNYTMGPARDGYFDICTSIEDDKGTIARSALAEARGGEG